MRVDQHGQHAQRLVALDESHAAHIGGELVDRLDAAHRLARTRQLLQIPDHVLGVRVLLIPLVERLDVRHAHAMALREQGTGQVAANESTATRDEHGLGHG